MAIVAAVAAVVGAGTAVVGTVLATKARKQAIESQRVQRNVEVARERRRQVREARIKRGALVNTAATTGTAGSSGELGGIGSIESQLFSNASFLDTSIAAGDSIAASSSRAATFGGIANFGISLFNLAGGASAIAGAVNPAPTASVARPAGFVGP